MITFLFSAKQANYMYCYFKSVKASQFMSFQLWIEQEIGTDDFFMYLSQQKNPLEVDGVYLVMCAQYLGRNISVVHSGGIWSSDDNIVHENVLVYKGAQCFFPHRCRYRQIPYIFCELLIIKYET